MHNTSKCPHCGSVHKQYKSSSCPDTFLLFVTCERPDMGVSLSIRSQPLMPSLKTVTMCHWPTTTRLSLAIWAAPVPQLNLGGKTDPRLEAHFSKTISYLFSICLFWHLNHNILGQSEIFNTHVSWLHRWIKWVYSIIAFSSVVLTTTISWFLQVHHIFCQVFVTGWCSGAERQAGRNINNKKSTL